MFPFITMRIFYGWILFFTFIILSKGECPTTPLFAFIQNSTVLTTMSTNGQYHLTYVGSYNNTATNGSYVPMKCNSGYILASGQLNITCVGDNWTTFPTCTQTSTKLTQRDNLPCTVNVATTFVIDNGYISDASGLSLLSDTAAVGSLVFACYTGYALDPTVGGTYKCNNGVWSTKPTCTITGRCVLAQLQAYLNTSVGIVTTGQSNLMQVSGDSTTVLNGSYIVLACYTGYTHSGGSLNVTCSAASTWSTFPTCVSNTAEVTTTTVAGGGSGGSTGATCLVDMSSTFNITNGYIADASALLFQSNTAATGSIVFACNPGYVLNPSVGATYTCTNGVWSTKPTCLITGRCSFTQLQTFLNTSVGLVTTGQSNLMQVSGDSTTVLNGSYIVLACYTGYTNNGGSLNVTCSTSSTWSTFPNCVSNTAGVTTTTVASGNGGATCVVDMSSTFTVANGYISDTSSLTLLSSTAATGSVVFACNPGFALDSNVGGRYTCTNGVWSTKPTCSSTGRCSFTQLQTFLNTSVGLVTTGQSNLTQVSGDNTTVVGGSYIVLACYTGYTNNGGSLNVTCSTSSTWSTFPNCVSNTAGVTTTTVASGNGGATCVVDMSSTFTVANGYISDTSSLTLLSSTAATGSVVFACNPGFALDSNVGGRYTCTNGVWSTKPTCSSTGRCVLAQLQTFLNTSVGIMTTGQSNLTQVSGDNTTVVGGSYIVLACSTGYTNNGGSLNVTCSTASSWSTFPNCVSNTAGVTTTTVASGNGGTTCVVDMSSTFTVANGYISDSSSLTLLSSTTATGSVVFACNSGYALDPNVGGRYTCTNGVWSTKPTCSSTGRCSFTTLQTFLNTSVGLVTTGQSNLTQVSGDSTTVVGGSYIVLACYTGYTNNGGSLNVTCSTAGSWSTFPNCVLNSGAVTTTTTTSITQAVVTTVAYSATCATVPTVDNSYISSATSITHSNGNYQRTVVFACNPGYSHVTTSGQLTVSCVNGVWGTLPTCSASPTCSKDELQALFTTGIAIESHSLRIAQVGSTGILAGSWIKLACSGNYKWNPTSGALNVTCLTTAKWSTAPTCYL